MGRMKLLGLALMAVFAFGIVAAATASAEEKEPSGLLYLAGEEGPVIIKGTGKEVTLLTDGLLKTEIKCLTVKSEGELGKGEGTHSTLGTLTIDYEGCKLGGKIACSSENIKGEKDPKETILQVAGDTDAHAASLLNGTKLVAGLIIGLLELVEGEKKLDLTLNCAGVKVLVLGSTFLEIQKASPTADVTEVGISGTELKCDSADTLCAKEFEKWGVKALEFNKKTEKDELVTCPSGLAAFVKEAEECSLIKIAVPIVTTISKMVLIDF
jgi:hypothetical protein